MMKGGPLKATTRVMHDTIEIRSRIKPKEQIIIFSGNNIPVPEEFDLWGVRLEADLEDATWPNITWETHQLLAFAALQFVWPQEKGDKIFYQWPLKYIPCTQITPEVSVTKELMPVSRGRPVRIRYLDKWEFRIVSMFDKELLDDIPSPKTQYPIKLRVLLEGMYYGIPRTPQKD